MRRLGLFIIGVAVIALTAATPAHAQLPTFDPAAIYKIALGDSPRRGPDDAPVTMVMWSDFACQYCAQLERTLPDVVRLYPGKLRLVFRQLPLDSDQTLAAEASLAAASQGAFWPMHDRLYAVRGRVDRVAVETMAAELGLNVARFRSDLDAGAYRAEVVADAQAAVELGITGTPTLFINGRALRGAQSVAAYTRVIDEELARAGTSDYQTLVKDGLTIAATDPASIDQPDDELSMSAQYAIGLGLPGHSDGPADALVTVVEFADFECHFCRVAAPVLAKLRSTYPDDVRVVYRHLPLSMHPSAPLAAEAAVAAAAEGKFWPMHAQLMTASGLTRADLEAAAAAVGLDRATFSAALDERRYREAVALDKSAAYALGLSGTPTIFVNGAPIVGAPSWDALRAAVDVQLDIARGLVAAGVERRDVYAIIAATATFTERGDPSRIPQAGDVPIEMGQVAREASAIAACRARLTDRAISMSSKLRGAARSRAVTECAANGIDLP